MIFGLGGKLSGGKTVTAVAYAYEEYLKGKRIISNIRLQFPDMTKVTYLKNEDFIEFLSTYYENEFALKTKFSDSVLILDEIVNLISSRQSGTAINQLITNFLVLTGKIDCHVVYTFQAEQSQVDKILREICNIYAECYRLDENGNPIIFKERKLEKPVKILVILELDFGIAGVKHFKLLYDPQQYYSMYDTTQFSLLKRHKYMRGGSRDLRKI